MSRVAGLFFRSVVCPPSPGLTPSHSLPSRSCRSFIMKYQYLAVGATTLLSTVNAFPRMNPDQLKTYYEHSKKEAEAAGCPFAAAQRREADAAAEAGCPFAKKQKRDDYTFNSEEQLIDVTGRTCVQASQPRGRRPERPMPRPQRPSQPRLPPT